MDEPARGKLRVDWGQPDTVTFTAIGSDGSSIAVTLERSDASYIAKRILGAPADILREAETKGHA